jgi:hypothetical protein
MIINNNYFVGQIYLAHAVQSVSDNVTGVALNLKNFRDKYELDCLVKSLGRVLATEFIPELDDTQANGLKPTADAKWDKLLNGTNYVNEAGDAIRWEGIRRESVIGSGEYNQSFLANYVYWFYHESFHDTVGGIGFQTGKSVNSENADPTPKVTNAWREFVSQVQGEYNHYGWHGCHSENNVEIFNTRYGLGISGFSTNNNTGLVSMYQFILDTNETTPDTYEDFNPKNWIVENQNQFGI